MMYPHLLHLTHGLHRCQKEKEKKNTQLLCSNVNLPFPERERHAVTNVVEKCLLSLPGWAESSDHVSCLLSLHSQLLNLHTATEYGYIDRFDSLWEAVDLYRRD